MRAPQFCREQRHLQARPPRPALPLVLPALPVLPVPGAAFPCQGDLQQEHRMPPSCTPGMTQTKLSLQVSNPSVEDSVLTAL